MNKKILLVEDNPDDVELTRHALVKSNIVNELIVVTDGVEALQYLRDPNNAMPAVVLLDLKLPRLDGIETLRVMRSEERTRLVPVVVLTSSAEESDLIQSYRLGANSYVVKPVDFEQFVEATKRLGMYWLLLNTAPIFDTRP
ncbi:MAG TPA: response regulator [Thermoanaerobaculia bacterium]|nr:response regulator [Thermoanaerobaculia bacterium]